MRNALRGFTFIELAAVLLILSILAAFAMPSAQDMGTSLLAAQNTLRAHLRFAQSRAMGRNQAYGIRILDDGGYQLFNASSPGTGIPLPGDTADEHAFDGGITVGPSGTVVTFNQWGVPCSDQSAATPRTSDLTLTLSDQDDSMTLTVTQTTGYVP